MRKKPKEKECPCCGVDIVYGAHPSANPETHKVFTAEGKAYAMHRLWWKCRVCGAEMMWQHEEDDVDQTKGEANE